MRKELELWQFVAARLKRRDPVMLLVVAESSGSSPGRKGFKMAVAGNADDGGGLSGSIGGGVMEVNLVEQARGILAEAAARQKERRSAGKIDAGGNPAADSSPSAALVHQVHRENSAQASGMICSGKQTVVFYRLADKDLKTVRKIIQHLKNNRDGCLRIERSELTVAAGKIPPFDFKFEQRDENDFLYEEKIGFKNRLFIVGGGHCALALSELMSKMDFYITLFDDRAKLNTLAKNRFVQEKKIIASYEEIGALVEPGENVYAVVMTLGYKSDEMVIRRLLDKDFKYFGVLGSRAKMARLLKSLRDEGFRAERLNRIRTPAGIRINSRTPEEIAVSIAAEIIAVKNSKE